MNKNNAGGEVTKGKLSFKIFKNATFLYVLRLLYVPGNNTGSIIRGYKN
jgi:hypothetical protein